ncbi:transposase [Streptomyces sp. M10(2022)]
MALPEPVITSWKAQHPSVSGHQGVYEMREIVNALLYQSRTGCQWDYLPTTCPGRRGEVLLLQVTRRWHRPDHPRPAALVGPREPGRKVDPSLVVLDTQSLHAAVGAPADTTGRDAAKVRAASAAWRLMFSVW